MLSPIKKISSALIIALACACAAANAIADDSARAPASKPQYVFSDREKSALARMTPEESTAWKLKIISELNAGNIHAEPFAGWRFGDKAPAGQPLVKYLWHYSGDSAMHIIFREERMLYGYGENEEGKAIRSFFRNPESDPDWDVVALIFSPKTRKLCKVVKVSALMKPERCADALAKVAEKYALEEEFKKRTIRVDFVKEYSAIKEIEDSEKNLVEIKKSICSLNRFRGDTKKAVQLEIITREEHSTTLKGSPLFFCGENKITRAEIEATARKEEKSSRYGDQSGYRLTLTMSYPRACEEARKEYKAGAAAEKTSEKKLHVVSTRFDGWKKPELVKTVVQKDTFGNIFSDPFFDGDGELDPRWKIGDSIDKRVIYAVPVKDASSSTWMTTTERTIVFTQDENCLWSHVTLNAFPSDAKVYRIRLASKILSMESAAELFRRICESGGLSSGEAPWALKRAETRASMMRLLTNANGKSIKAQLDATFAPKGNGAIVVVEATEQRH